jgi:WhiB family redox-sensing transcriptional regulator
MKRNLSWQEDAKCKGGDVEVFYLPFNARMAEKRRLIAEAKKVCAGCSVREQCLNYALDIKEPYGVWGGMSEEERRVLLRRKGIVLAS